MGKITLQVVDEPGHVRVFQPKDADEVLPIGEVAIVIGEGAFIVVGDGMTTVVELPRISFAFKYDTEVVGSTVQEQLDSIVGVLAVALGVTDARTPPD